jgi:hypothetical protein
MKFKTDIDRKIEALRLSAEAEKLEKLKKKEEEFQKQENARKLDRLVNEQKQQSRAFLAQLQAHKEASERERAFEMEKAKTKAEMSRLPEPSWFEVCSFCKSEQHKPADCPQNFCKRCAKQGHLVMFSRLVIKVILRSSFYLLQWFSTVGTLTPWGGGYATIRGSTRNVKFTDNV